MRTAAKITYLPSKDELLLKLCPVKGKPTKDLGRYKLWWNDKGDICALAIEPFMEELEEFLKHRIWVRLGGLWKGVKIDEDDIKEARQELLKKLEERWEMW